MRTGSPSPLGDSLLESPRARMGAGVLALGIAFLSIALATPAVAAELFAPPLPLSISPARGALDVPRSSHVAVHLDQEMDAGTLSDATFMVVGEVYGPYEGTVMYEPGPGNSVVTFLPSRNFQIGERITAFLTSGVRSAAEIPISPYAWSFTVEAQPVSMAFSLDSTYFAARLPFEMFATDVNRDGFSDLAVAHTPSGSGTLAVHTDLAAGNLDFLVTTAARSAGGPRGIHAGDYSGDRFPDIAMTTSIDSSFVVYRNNGAGAFPDTAVYKTSLLAYNVTGADFDGDGDMDLAMGNLQGPQILIARNTGGIFGNFSTVVADSSPRNLEVFDLDGDGRRELIAVNANSKVSVFRDLGGFFGPDTTYPVGLRSLGLYVNDLNGDGHLDAAVSNVQGGSLSLLFNRGDGRFGEDSLVVLDSVNVGAGKNTLFDVCGGDFDGDGDIDLATANWFTGRFFVLANDGAGRFTVGFASDSVGIGLQNLAGGDFDGDGDLDLAITNWQNGKFRIYRSGPAGLALVEKAPQAYSITCDPAASVLARFSAEVAPASLSPETVFLTSAVRGRVPAALSYDSGSRTLAIAPGESLMACEEIEVALTREIVSVLGDSLAPRVWRFSGASRPGSRSFQVDSQLPLGWIPLQSVAGDFDGDGAIDLAVLRGSLGGVMTMFRNSGTGSLQNWGSASLNGVLRGAAGFDLDRDSRVEVVASNINPPKLQIAEVAGDSISVVDSVELPLHPNAIVPGDYDADGWTDLVVTTVTQDLLLVKNNAGTLGAPVTVPHAAPVQGGLAIDFDLDGDLDLATFSKSPTRVELIRNDGTSGFASDTVFTGSWGEPVDLRAGDASGDGFPDLFLACNSTSQVVPFLSSPGGALSAGSGIPLAAVPVAIELVDADGDGQLDLVATGANGPVVLVRYGLGAGEFGADSLFSTPFLVRRIAAGDFQGHGRPGLALTGSSTASILIMGNGAPTGVASGPDARPGTRLFPARPNPANPNMVIPFELAEPGRVRLRVYNVAGALVRTLIDGPGRAGMGSATWDGSNEAGKAVGSGTYLYRLDAGSFHGEGKVVILR